ncbi:hypothetical protein PAPYR_2541 [Paratrimastix pyriformis]|uniref:Uncharacterized protein n=1 Tax=Paratrimastix pyriformis TaxID=342808 RepID=A0ABQ8UPL4_9EUKA|nr:hypothetical protein PAPYR_2541 [Paratrimastix pyriformis]
MVLFQEVAFPVKSFFVRDSIVWGLQRPSFLAVPFLRSPRYHLGLISVCGVSARCSGLIETRHPLSLWQNVWHVPEEEFGSPAGSQSLGLGSGN